MQAADRSQAGERVAVRAGRSARRRARARHRGRDRRRASTAVRRRSRGRRSRRCSTSRSPTSLEAIVQSHRAARRLPDDRRGAGARPAAGRLHGAGARLRRGGARGAGRQGPAAALAPAELAEVDPRGDPRGRQRAEASGPLPASGLALLKPFLWTLAAGEMSSGGRLFMAETADSKTVALPAIVDLDALDTVRDGLIDAVEIGPGGGRRLAASSGCRPMPCSC